MPQESPPESSEDVTQLIMPTQPGDTEAGTGERSRLEEAEDWRPKDLSEIPEEPLTEMFLESDWNPEAGLSSLASRLEAGEHGFPPNDGHEAPAAPPEAASPEPAPPSGGQAPQQERAPLPFGSGEDLERTVIMRRPSVAARPETERAPEPAQPRATGLETTWGAETVQFKVEEVKALADAKPASARKPLPLIGAAVALVAVIAGGLVWWLSEPAATPPVEIPPPAAPPPSAALPPAEPPPPLPQQDAGTTAEPAQDLPPEEAAGGEAEPGGQDEAGPASAALPNEPGPDEPAAALPPASDGDGAAQAEPPSQAPETVQVPAEPAPEPAPRPKPAPKLKPAPKPRPSPAPQAAPKPKPAVIAPAAPTPEPAALPGWLGRLRAELAVCEEKSFFAKAICREKVRWSYCAPDRWDTVPECSVKNQ